MLPKKPQAQHHLWIPWLSLTSMHVRLDEQCRQSPSRDSSSCATYPQFRHHHLVNGDASSSTDHVIAFTRHFGQICSDIRSRRTPRLWHAEMRMFSHQPAHQFGVASSRMVGQPQNTHNLCPGTEQVGFSPILPSTYVPPAGHFGISRWILSRPNKSASTGTSFVVLWFSSAHIAFALSISRRLFLQNACA